LDQPIIDITHFKSLILSMATAKEKKEEVKKYLKKLRAELRVIHLAVTDELKLPDPEEVKVLMKEMEDLLLVIDPKSAKKSKKKAK